MFAVAGVSGHTGAATANALLKRGQKVRVLVRNEAQGEPWARRHCEVAVVDLHQTDALAAAVKDLTGAYLLLPPVPNAENELAAHSELLGHLVAAVKRSGLKSLAFLSAAGAQHPAGTGPFVALHQAEHALKGIVPSVTFIRAAWFIENWAASFMEALETGELPHFGHTHLKFAQVCARDIGDVAARALEEHKPGTHVVELAGPENWSAEDVAAALTALLSQPIKAVERPVKNARELLEKSGMKPATAALYAELYQGMSRGLLHFVHPTQVVHGTTPLFDALKSMV